jgi:hypothetical protein
MACSRQKTSEKNVPPSPTGDLFCTDNKNNNNNNNKNKAIEGIERREDGEKGRFRKTSGTVRKFVRLRSPTRACQ